MIRRYSPFPRGVGRWLALAGLLLGAIGLPLPAAAETLTLITTDYPPYCATELPEQGAFTALARAAFKAGGYDTQVVFQPWARVMAASRAGQYDAVLAVWHQKEREQFLAFADPLWTNQIGFYGRVDKPIDVSNLNALKPYSVGVVRGYAYPPAFDAAGLRIEEAVDDLTNVRKLLAGRVDLILIDHALTEYLLETRLPGQGDRIAWLSPAVATVPLYVTLVKGRPGWEKRLADFNRGLAEIRRSGEYDRIVKRLGLVR